MFFLSNSSRWHLWEIDLRFALNSTPGWEGHRDRLGGVLGLGRSARSRDRPYRTQRINSTVLESQLPHKTVNLWFTIINQNNKEESTAIAWGEYFASGDPRDLATDLISHTSYQLNGFGKSSPPKNRQLMVYYYKLKQSGGEYRDRLGRVPGLARSARQILYHTTYQFNGFGKSTFPQNRQLIVYYD